MGRVPTTTRLRWGPVDGRRYGSAPMARHTTSDRTGLTRKRYLLLLTAIALVGAGCGGSSDGDAPTASTPTTHGSTSEAATDDPRAAHAIGTFGVGRADLDLIDPSRPTAAHGDQPELPERTLPTMVLYPTAPPDSEGYEDVVAVTPDAPPVGGPAPLIVFGHGSTRAGPDYLDTLVSWSSAGYVVVAPNFPLSTTGAPGGTDYGGIAEQTGDVSFVIDEVLARSADPDDPLAGTIDPERIGIGGQSFGAITAIATTYNACCADPRIDAMTEFAGMWFDLGEGDAVAPAAADVPGLFIHSAGDGVVPIAGDRQAAADAAGAGAPVQFVTLVGSDHDAGFFEGTGRQPDDAVTRATLAFYDQHLKDDPDGASRVTAAIEDAGPDVASIEVIEP